MSAPRRLLFFSNLLAMPGHHGGCVYPYGVLTALHARGVAIDYAWLGRPLAGGRRVMRNPLTAPYVSRSRVRGAWRLGRFLLANSVRGWLGTPRDPGEDGTSGEHWPTPHEQAFAAGVIRRLGATAVVVDFTSNLPILDTLAPAERALLHVGVLTHNLQSRRTELYQKHGQPLDFLPMTAAEEAAFLARSDLVVAIQEREAEAFRALLPDARVVTVPMPVEARPQPPEREVPGRCLFVGGFSGHNLEALQWLLRDIWPAVRAAVPDAELVVAGTVGQSVTAPLPGVRVVGAVGDLSAVYGETAVSLVPLPMGTGLKIKLVEAMGQGRAVVTTPAGAEGFAEIEAGQVAVVAETAENFAAAVIALLQSAEWRRTVTLRQLEWIKRRLAPAQVVAPLDELWSPCVR